MGPKQRSNEAEIREAVALIEACGAIRAVARGDEKDARQCATLAAHHARMALEAANQHGEKS